MRVQLSCSCALSSWPHKKYCKNTEKCPFLLWDQIKTSSFESVRIPLSIFNFTKYTPDYQTWPLVIGVTAVITVKATFPRRLTVSTAQGTSHGFSHETTAMAIKKPITSSARRLTSAFCMWGPAVAMVPGPAFACERLRQPSGVSRTHNRKTLVVLLNCFSLLPSWFREGWGDVQTQHTTNVNSRWSLPPPMKQKRLHMKRVCVIVMIHFS